MKIKVINKSKNTLPKYETENAAGMDLRADLDRVVLDSIKNMKFGFDANYHTSVDGNFIEINPGGRCLIPTGLFIELPVGYEAQIRPRSGLALKKGITVLNSPGTIDARLQ